MTMCINKVSIVFACSKTNCSALRVSRGGALHYMTLPAHPQNRNSCLEPSNPRWPHLTFFVILCSLLFLGLFLLF